METKSSFIRADGTVELYTIAIIDLHLTIVVDPRNTEENLPFRGGQTLQQCIPPVLFLILLDNRANSGKELPDCLMKLGLSRVLGDYPLQDFIYIRHDNFLLWKFL